MKIRATVSRIRYRNENGWCVADFVDETNLHFVCVGIMPGIYEDEKLELEGDWQMHRTYGQQFAVTGFSIVPIDGLEAMLKYLAGGAVKGIGLATAKAIVNEFGERTLEVLANEPRLLERISGIGPVKSKMIHDSFMEKRGTHELFVALTSLGLTPRQSAKAFSLYGENCVRIIRENPYRLISDIDGIGFKTADKIAEASGIDQSSEFRIKAGVKYLLGEARNDGNTCLPKETLVMNSANNVLNIELLPVENAVEEMIIDGELVEKHIDGRDMVFLSYLYRVESDSAVCLTELVNEARILPFFDIEGGIDALEERFAVRLDETQRSAVRLAFEKGVLVITGGPGTGKTTILKFIIELMEGMELKYRLTAPTGRASKRMADMTGREAKTIHRLLEYGGAGDESFARDASNPIEADVIIADEMSMVDIVLFHSLIKATEKGTRLILVGDVDQLPPVGAGNTLKDIILSDTVPVIRLTEIYRQAGRSLIVLNAHRINNGMLPVVGGSERDFLFIPAPDAEKALNIVLDKCSQLMSSGASDYQVLSPMKMNIIGVNNLNKRLQETLNPPARGKLEMKYGEDTVFRVGDRVMQTRNNYLLEWKRESTGEESTGVFNGDIGTVMRISPDGSAMEVLFDDERLAVFGQAELEDIELAYAVSVHKSQGSEFSTVIIPLVTGPRMLMSRNILYTAVTRARDCVILIGTKSCVESMIRNTQNANRFSALRFFLRELNEGQDIE